MKNKTLMKKLSFIYGVFAMMTAMILVGCSDSDSSSDNALSYLAVKYEQNDNWNIFDKNGQVVVKDEYAPDCEISKITDNGVFWVKQGDKFQLYSVKSPKKPLTDEEYDGVTDFDGGLAFASKSGDPILLIDESGKVKRQLDREISNAYTYSNGLALVKNKEGKYGYVDKNGEIAIKPQYEVGDDFKEGYARVVKIRDGNHFIIDKKGKEVTEIKKSLYSGLIICEGYCLLNSKNDDTQWEIINLKDMSKTRLKKKYKRAFIRNGYIEVSNGDNEAGILDLKGDLVIRMGKYSDINHLGNGLFAASKNGKSGIIDKDDNTVIDFEYDGIIYNIRLGSNFIVVQNRQGIVIDAKGKELSKTGFVEMGMRPNTDVAFVDHAYLANELTKDITTNGFKPLIGKNTASDICPALKMDCTEELRSKTYVGLPDTLFGYHDMHLTAYFDRPVVAMNYHTETVNDGWFEHERMIEDGIGWNQEANFTFFTIIKYGTNDYNMGTMRKLISEALKSKGFIENDGKFDPKDGKGWTVKIGEESSPINLTITKINNETDNTPNEE